MDLVPLVVLVLTGYEAVDNNNNGDNDNHITNSDISKNDQLTTSNANHCAAQKV